MGAIILGIGRTGSVGKHRVHARSVGTAGLGDHRALGAAGAVFTGSGRQGQRRDRTGGEAERDVRNDKYGLRRIRRNFVQIGYDHIRSRVEYPVTVIEVDRDVGGIEAVGVRMGTRPPGLLSHGKAEIQCSVRIVGHRVLGHRRGLPRRNGSGGPIGIGHGDRDLAVNREGVRRGRSRLRETANLEADGHVVLDCRSRCRTRRQCGVCNQEGKCSSTDRPKQSA